MLSLGARTIGGPDASDICVRVIAAGASRGDPERDDERIQPVDGCLRTENDGDRIRCVWVKLRGHHSLNGDGACCLNECCGKGLEIPT